MPNIDLYLSQLSLFIGQFNDLVVSNDINVITDSSGNISIDVPKSMTEEHQIKLARKVGIIDRLISERSSNLDVLFKEGLELEKNIKKNDVQYTSVIAEKARAFSELKNKYKH